MVQPKVDVTYVFISLNIFRIKITFEIYIIAFSSAPAVMQYT